MADPASTAPAPAPTDPYNVGGALKAGYSPAEIVGYLGTHGIDTAPALKAGYSPGEIVNYLATLPGQPPAPQTSATSAFLHGAAESALPGAGAWAAAGAGAELGGGLGALVPGMGETGISEGVGAVAGSLIGFFGGARAVGAVQQAAISALPASVQRAIGEAPEQVAAREEQHPYASMAGALVPNLLFMRPGVVQQAAEDAPKIAQLLSNPIAARTLGAGAGAAMEAGQESQSDQGLDPLKIAMAAGAGALMNRETALGERVSGIGAAPVAAVRGALSPRPIAPAPVPETQPTPAEAVGNVMHADNVDDAIGAAEEMALRQTPVDLAATTAALDAGQPGDQDQARLLRLFGSLGTGTVEHDGEGGFQFRTTDASGDEAKVPLQVWNPDEAPEAPDGSTVAPQTAAAISDHYAEAGVRTVFYQDHPGIPFDGAVDPQQPDTVFLSNNPVRAAAQVAGHEFAHVLQSTTLPDGSSLGDLLSRQIAAGLTPEGRAYAELTFGVSAPQRAAFPTDAAHAAAVQAHLINELGADIGGEAPKFQTFLPKVVNAIQARFGDSVAADVLGKLVNGLKSAIDTVRGLFGSTATESQNWVTNLGEIHDTLARMYAERFGAPVEREQARLAAMKDRAARNGVAAAPQPPQEGVSEAAPPEAAAGTPEAAQARDALAAKALTQRRWLAELGDERPAGVATDTPEMARLRAEHAATADALTRMPTAPDPFRTVPREPERLATFLRRAGGLQDEGGDVRSILGGARFRPGLINENGRPLDDATRLAWEHGYFPERGEDRPEINDLLDKLDLDLNRGQPQYSWDDAVAVANYQSALAHNSEIDRLAAQYGIETRGRTAAQFADDLAEHVSLDEAARMAQPEADAFDAADAEFGRRAAALGTEPAEYAADDAPRSLEDLEDEYRQEEAAAGPAEDAGRPGGPEAATGGAGAGQEGDGSRPGGAGIGRGGAAEGGAAAVAPSPRPPRNVAGQGDIFQGEQPGPAPKREPEPTIRTDRRQIDMFGTADAAVQAQAARDQAGRGALAPKGGQKAADEGLFARPAPKGGTLFSPRREEDRPLYSALQRGVEGLKLDKAAPGQWLSTIKNMPGVKAEELRWSGIEDWLKQQPKSVTRAEVSDYLRANALDLREVVRGAPIEPPDVAAMRERFQELSDREEGQGRLLSAEEGAEMDRLRGELSEHPNPWLSSDAETRYGSYTLPGGENYREMLVTLPRREREGAPIEAGDGLDGFALRPGQPTVDRAPEYRSSHWDEPNVLAHVRFDERTAPDGKKTLLVEEVQSDWHQAGRKKGYRLSDAERASLDGRRAELVGKGRERTREERREWADIENRLQDNGNAPPDAPFKTTWPALVMKRMIAWAVDHGFDRVAWVPGNVQADRYDLSKQVDRIGYTKRTDGKYNISAERNGQHVMNEDGITIDRVADMVGKDLAEKIEKAETNIYDRHNGNRTGELKGLDLKVGGEGMRAFYDKMLPAQVNKIVGKYGAKVGQSKVEIARGATPDDVEMQPVHSLDITPPLRRAVQDEGLPMFSPRTPNERPEAARAEVEQAPELGRQEDDVSRLINAVVTERGGVAGTANPPTVEDRDLSRIAQLGGKAIKNLNPFERSQTIFPRTLAALDSKFGAFYRAWMARETEGHANLADLRTHIAVTLLKLPDAASRDRVFAAAELSRKWNAWPKTPELRVRVRNTSYWQAQKSKIGDDYLLSDAETKAFHDLLNLGRQQWATFMSALVRRENWTGAPDPVAIEAAAKEAGLKLPEGKRLMRLAEAVRAVQAAQERPYFPATRFGDIYLAVTPKPGPDLDTVSVAKGRPELQWFQTVERPAMRDLFGRNRLPPDQMPEVQQAIAALSARKDAHGNLPFGGEFKNTAPGVWESATHRIETGDLARNPDVLRQLNIPAIEKLFMLLERRTESAMVEKVMEEQTPDEGLSPKEAAEMKRRVARYGSNFNLIGGEAKEQYQALLGTAKETLLDELYRALLAGWKKQASLVPGYSDDFERAIGTHMGQVARNAADMVHRGDIDATYQDVVDNHPNLSVRQYIKEFRREQEDPHSVLARAASSAGQIGTVWAMGLNPASTMKIALHNIMMGGPVLSVGVGMRRAAAELAKATAEVYRHASFDMQRGASIDATQLGQTDAERAFVADMERTGLTHSQGADDIRQIDDRQATMWGTARPMMRRVMDIALSNVSLVDRANRLAVGLAAHRIAANHSALMLAAKPLMRDNALFRAEVDHLTEQMTRGAIGQDMRTAQAQAIREVYPRFMIDQAAGQWGRTNQAPAMRGVEGAMYFKFRGYQTRYLSTMLSLLKNSGPEGRVAAMWMLAGLGATAGAYGIPFLQDIENGGDALWKFATNEDPMIDAHIRELMADAGVSKLGAEMTLRGPASIFTGTDLSSATGFGELLSRPASPADLLGVVPSMMARMFYSGVGRIRSGQGAAAGAAELLPAALRNPAEAAIQARQGIFSAQGSPAMTAGQLSTADIAKRAIGLTPLDVAQARARRNFAEDTEHKDDQLREYVTRSVAILGVRAKAADAAGDHAQASDLRTEASELVQRYSHLDINEKAYSDAAFQAMAPDLYRLTRTRAVERSAVMNSPYP